MLPPRDSNHWKDQLANLLEDNRTEIVKQWIEAVQTTDSPHGEKETLAERIQNHLEQVLHQLNAQENEQPVFTQTDNLREEANIILRGEEMIAHIFENSLNHESANDRLKARYFVNRVFCNYLQKRYALCSVLPKVKEEGF